MSERLSASEIDRRKRRTIFDVSYLVELFVKNKRWFALSVVLCLLLAGAYIYWSRPAYSVVGKMMMIERRSGNSATASALAMMNNLPFGLGSSLGVGRSLGSENEKEIIKAKSMAKEVVTDLDLYTEYRLEKNLKSRLLYKTQPVCVSVTPETLEKMADGQPVPPYRIMLTVKKTDDGYTVKGKLSRNGKKTALEELTSRNLPVVVHTKLGDLTLTENTSLTASQREKYQKGYTLDITILPPMTAAKVFSKRMSVESASKKATSIIHLTMQDESVQRGIDFINRLVEVYNRKANEDRREEVARNDSFVNVRLAKIDRELELVDADLEHYKQQYRVTDARVDAEEVITRKSVYESQLVNLGIQAQLLDYLSEYVSDPSNRYELIPSTVGSVAGDSIPLINRHNALVSELKLMLKSVSEQSPQAKLQRQLIDELHPTVITAIGRYRHSLSIRQKVADREYNKYMSRVGSVPEAERVLTEVNRQRNIKQGVYVSLLQKREENAMEMTNFTEKSKLIDETQFVRKVKPRAMVTLLLALFAGLLVPYIVLFLRRSLSKTIGDYEDLKTLTPLPVIGQIPAGSTDTDEPYQALRANLLHQTGKDKKVILVTSYADGDGKTYNAVRIERLLTNAGRRVAMYDLSTLSADILASERLTEQIDELKASHDYVILDGPSIGQHGCVFGDGLADATCYVCRAGKTPKTGLKQLEQLSEEGRLASPCLIMNAC